MAKAHRLERQWGRWECGEESVPFQCGPPPWPLDGRERRRRNALTMSTAQADSERVSPAVCYDWANLIFVTTLESLLDRPMYSYRCARHITVERLETLCFI